MHSKIEHSPHSSLRRNVQLSPGMHDRYNRYTINNSNNNNNNNCETSFSNVATPKVINGDGTITTNNINNTSSCSSGRTGSAAQRRPSARASMAGALLHTTDPQLNVSSPPATTSRFIPSQRETLHLTSIVSPISYWSASPSRKVSSMSL